LSWAVGVRRQAIAFAAFLIRLDVGDEWIAKIGGGIGETFVGLELRDRRYTANRVRFGLIDITVEVIIVAATAISSFGMSMRRRFMIYCSSPDSSRY
jgi:hypothetical protein